MSAPKMQAGASGGAGASFEQSVRADERARLAREIHDGLGQTLVALSMEAARILPQAEGARPLVEAHWTALREACAELRETQARWKAATASGIAAPESFARVVVHLTEDAARRGAFTFRVEVDVDDRALDAPRALAAARALEAALDNVVRHAGARRVNVEARLRDGRLEVNVDDDGRGFDPSTAEGPTSTGLLSMRERTAAHGGTATVRTSLGGGTRIGLTFPLAAPESSR
jgi:signal transduction histidine kinase